MRRTTFITVLSLAGLACSDDVSGPDEELILPELGDILTLNVLRNVDNPCVSPDTREGRVVAVTSRSIVAVDTQNPSVGLSDEEYASFGAEFDVVTYPVVAEAFGEPSDLDQNERVIAFFTRGVNELTREDDEGFIFGYFWAGDLLPSTGGDGCAASNEAEVVYLAVPDPNGQVGVQIDANTIRDASVATLGHELQHLVNASRRLFVNASGFEEIWLDEGLSHVAEELLFYAYTGTEPGDNIDVESLTETQSRTDAFFEFQYQNVDRFARFLDDPGTEAASLINAEATLASRGSGWHFLRYSADRLGSESEFWFSLVNTSLTGLDNLTQALGTDIEVWIHDWSAAAYADDEAVTDADFQFPSWDLRDIYPALVDTNEEQVYPEYPLALRRLTDAKPLDLAVAGMAVAYVQVNVPAAGTATVSLRPGGVTPLAQLRLAVVNASTGEVERVAGDDAAKITLEAGAASATYVLAVLNTSKSPGAMLPVEVESSGAGTATLASAPSRGHALAPRGSLALSATMRPLRAVNHRFHIDLLERARRQLTPRMAAYARKVYQARILDASRR